MFISLSIISVMEISSRSISSRTFFFVSRQNFLKHF